MTTEKSKEIKGVVSFLSVLGILVLVSYIIDRQMSDLLYLFFIVYFIIRYLYLSIRS